MEKQKTKKSEVKMESEFRIEGVKTLWELLQDLIEKEDKWYSLHEFLLEANEYERKDIEHKLAEADYKQFYEFMDAYSFVSKDEILMACQNYREATMNRAISMWECMDLYEVADDYVQERNLKFDEDEDEEYENLPF